MVALKRAGFVQVLCVLQGVLLNSRQDVAEYVARMTCPPHLLVDVRWQVLARHSIAPFELISLAG